MPGKCFPSVLELLPFVGGGIKSGAFAFKAVGGRFLRDSVSRVCKSWFSICKDAIELLCYNKNKKNIDISLLSL